MCEENADRIYAEIFLILMIQTLVSQECHFKTRIVDKTFEEIDLFSKFLIILEISKQDI